MRGMSRSFPLLRKGALGRKGEGGKGLWAGRRGPNSAEAGGALLIALGIAERRMEASRGRGSAVARYPIHPLSTWDRSSDEMERRSPMDLHRSGRASLDRKGYRLLPAVDFRGAQDAFRSPDPSARNRVSAPRKALVGPEPTKDFYAIPRTADPIPQGSSRWMIFFTSSRRRK